MLLRVERRQAAFELIGYAKVSTSAEHARKLGLLRAGDAVSMNPERLIADAKARRLSLAATTRPARRGRISRWTAKHGFALLKLGIYMARQGDYITEYDAVVGEKLATF